MSLHDTFRDRFLDAQERFHAAQLAALRAQQDRIVVFMSIQLEGLGKVDALQGSVDELKRLLLEHGAAITALRERLDENGNNQ